MHLKLCQFQKAALKRVLARRADRDLVHVVELPTGAGKTRVGLAVVFKTLHEGGNILWLAKSWELLRQALGQLREADSTVVGECRRIGGRSADLQIPTGNHGRVFFTTLQTFAKRRQTDLPKRVRASTNLVIVWDEAHWAQEAASGMKLKNRYLGKALVVGLTATPRESASGTTGVAYSVPYMELSKAGRLAEPRIRSISTGIDWTPSLAPVGEFAGRSLRELGRSEQRNKIIVDELSRGRQVGDFRRILIFACDIEHAERLETLCNRRGIPARAVHCRLSAEAQKDARQAFRRGNVDVLINVAQLMEGFDAPDVDAVFLTRPTASRLLVTQMFGRGARRLPEKTFFWAVDFTDILSRHGDRLFRAADLFPPAIVGGPGGAARPIRHDEPRDEPRFVNLGLPGLEKIPYAEGQTFGVEIELTRPIRRPLINGKWKRIGNELIATLKERVNCPVHPEPLAYHGNAEVGDPTRWFVTYDRSAGWEVISPILMNIGGFLELQRASVALSALVDENPWGLRVDHRTGLHVTLATRLNTTERLSGFVHRVERLEPGLFTLVAPSRLFKFDRRVYDLRRPNEFCRPLRETYGSVDLMKLLISTALESARHRSINLWRTHDDIQLLEVRMHHGTTNFSKIALWTCLWMQIFNRSRYAWTGNGVFGPVFDGDRRLSLLEVEQEDIIRLLELEGIFLGPQFVHLLKRRRRELLRYWGRALPRRTASWKRAGWNDGAADGRAVENSSPNAAS